MGTRGTYGLRKNKRDKLCYNQYDSYPSGLGEDILRAIKKYTDKQLVKIYENIELVDPDSIPTKEQIAYCEKNGWVDYSVDDRSDQNWYCLLRKLQDPWKLFDAALKGKVYMIDRSDFIKNSLWCEYGYILDLDTDTLEFYEGFQNTPDPDNRYGTQKNGEFYPCKLTKIYTFEDIREAVNDDGYFINDMEGYHDEEDENNQKETSEEDYAEMILRTLLIEGSISSEKADELRKLNPRRKEQYNVESNL